MKKIFLLGAIAVISLSASAQRANDVDASWLNDAQPLSYNLIGVSYDNTHLGGKNYEFKDGKSMSLNGFGIEYTHGFGLSSVQPIYLELGFKWNMGFGSSTWEDDYEYEKELYQMMRLNVPVSFAWRFAADDSFSITPYAGIDFRFNAMGRMKEEYIDGHKTDGKWESLFDEKKMGKNWTWNRFQMGWHIGVRAEYSRAFLGISYGTDFIHAFSYNKYKEDKHVSTGNLAITLGYRF